MDILAFDDDGSSRQSSPTYLLLEDAKIYTGTKQSSADQKWIVTDTMTGTPRFSRRGRITLSKY